MPRRRTHGCVQDAIRQGAAGVARHDQVGGGERDLSKVCLEEGDPSVESRPRGDDRALQRATRRGA